jgi:hypothetical protein
VPSDDRVALMDVARTLRGRAVAKQWEYEYLMHWGSARPLQDWEGVTVASEAKSPSSSAAFRPRCLHSTGDGGGSNGSDKEPTSVDEVAAAAAEAAVVVVVKLDLSGLSVTSYAPGGGRADGTAADGSSAAAVVAEAGGSSSRALTCPGVPVPRALAQLSGLRELNLCGLGLAGPVPMDLAALGGTLTRLNLSANRLTGHLSAMPWVHMLEQNDLSASHLFHICLRFVLQLCHISFTSISFVS